jgi:hypothetical protein
MDVASNKYLHLNRITSDRVYPTNYMRMPVLLLLLSLLLCVAVFVFAVPLAFRMWSPRSFVDTAPEAEETLQSDVRQELRDYVIEFLRRYPNVNTYLGGSSLAFQLREVDGELRDHSTRALEKEDRWLSSSLRSFEASGWGRDAIFDASSSAT